MNDIMRMTEKEKLLKHSKVWDEFNANKKLKMKTAEEILSNTDGTLELASNLRLYNAIIKAMEDYAAQFFTKEPKITSLKPSKDFSEPTWKNQEDLPF